MAKIKHSLASVSTDFQPLPAAVYDFQIKAIEDVEQNGVFKGYRIKSEVVSAEEHGRVFSDYLNFVKADGNPNEMGPIGLKRYFEALFGKEEVAAWTDDDYDTDLLIGKTWRGQIELDSYTPKDKPNAEPRPVNRIAAMEKL